MHCVLTPSFFTPPPAPAPPPLETGGVCIAPRPAEEGAEIVPAMAMRPFFGIEPVLMGEKVTITHILVPVLMHRTS